MVSYGCNVFLKAFISTCIFYLDLSRAAIHHDVIRNPPIGGIGKVNPYDCRSEQKSTRGFRNIVLSLHGGGESNDISTTSVEKTDDEERYSRQVYTLGARAHSLVRKSSIIVDGPVSSGLLYESVKNLALSGVGKIIILTSSDASNDSEDGGKAKICAIDTSKEQKYFDEDFDDLGILYRRGAKAECFPEKDRDEDVDDLQILLEYVKRLNPNVQIETMSRESLFHFIETKVDQEKSDIIGENPVFLCLERPQSSQLTLNDICRKVAIPFVSVETASVYGKVFCDFGNDFYVVDEDGETPKTTLLDKIERSDETNPKKKSDITIHCVDGEHHDVSKGDTIGFQWNNNGSNGSKSLQKITCEVVFVKNPTCFTAKIDVVDEDEQVPTDAFMQLANKNANSFSRIKVPKKLSFMPLSQAIKEAENPNCEVFAASDLDKSFDLSRRFAIMSAFETLDKFVERHDRLPQPFVETYEDDVNMFSSLIVPNTNAASTDVIDTFSTFSRAKFMPIQAIFGALGAQEVLKAASGLYNPIRQFLLYDSDEVLSAKSMKQNDVTGTTKAAGVKYILGNKLIKKLSSQKIFVVGSGAIGCERELFCPQQIL